MTRSMPRPVRRLAATAVLTAVAGAGALAAAPVALADTVGDEIEVAAPAAVAPVTPPEVSPLPKEPVTLKLKGFTLTIQPVVVQAVQTAIADHLAGQGRLYSYDSNGLLVVGPKICNPAKNEKANKGCVAADAPRV